MQNIDYQQKQTKVINWFAEKLKNNELDFETKLKIFDLVMQDLEVMSISEYSRQHNFTYNGTLSKIQTGSLHAMTFFSETFIFDQKKPKTVDFVVFQ